MRRGLVIAGVVGAVAFSGLAGWALVEHGSSCNPAYRHCPVDTARLDQLMGRWCNAPSLGQEGPARETFVREGTRVVKTREDLLLGTRVSADVRFVDDTGRILYRAYDANGRPASPYIAVARNGGDGRVSEIDGRSSGFIRCERMAEAGVPETVRALYR